MIRARVLQALASIAEGQSDFVAARRAAYAAIDPLVRGLVRGRAERAVAQALFETQHGDDEGHVHRLAYLQVAGQGAPNPDDIAASREAFEAQKTPSVRPRRPTKVALGLGAFAFLCAGALGYWKTRPPESLHEELTTSRAAWSEGGRPPPGSEAQGEVVRDLLPRYVAALDRVRASRGTDEQAAAEVRAEEASVRLLSASREAFGDDATSFLRAVVDQSNQIVHEDGSAATDSHIRSTDALNDALARLNLGYYVDAEVRTERPSGRHHAHRHHVYLSTFTVERVSFYESDGSRLRALRLRRLDRLNFARRMLGFTRPQVRDGLVLLDRIEGYMVDTVLPALGPEARMPLVDEASRDEGIWIEPLEEAAARDAREEATALVGEDALVLGELFATRHRILRGWIERFSQVRITLPRGFDFELERYRTLEELVPRSEWNEFASVAEDLEDDENRRAYRGIEGAFVDSIERHEVQHRLDYLGDTFSHFPEALVQYTGPPEVEGMENRRARQAVAELSAYLSELARDPRVVKMNLALFSTHLFRRPAWGTGECYAALVVFEGLARRLGISAHGSLTQGRWINRQTMAFLYLDIRARPSREIAEAAAALFEELFGAPLPPLERVQAAPSPAGG